MKKLKSIFVVALAITAMGMSATTPISVSEQNPVVSENFNSMWDATTSEALMTLPDGWAIDRNLDAPRTIGAWSNATNEVMYAGGASLASNAKNGTWNFGSTAESSDRAIGGLTTTVANGTRCVSLMAGITNESATPIDRFTLSYDIEKYRKGANAAGFAVQVYYSHDGEAWISAGEPFHTVFEPDSETIGAEEVPISTTNVDNRQMLVDVAPGETVYLAWNISVASGSTPDKAPGLAIDNISVTAGFASEDSKFIFVENALKAAKVTLLSTSTDFFGEEGSTTSLSKIVNGVEYMVWSMPSEPEFELTAVVAGQSYGPLSVSTDSDCYLCLSRDGLALIEDPLTYSGWTDPDRAPFVSSGIYIRGEVNSWGAVEEWEFSNEGNNTYVLYDKKLSGQFKVADSGWTSACNYGSNGSNISVDSPYQLQKGVDDNISCGAYVFDCKRIELSITDDSAKLLLEANDDDSGLTSVYVYGDFNNWDFMATNGELKLDESDNLFKGQISMKAGADGLSHWRIYQRQGMGGAWGLDQDADKSSLEGTLTKGSTGNAAVAPATYKFEFSLTDGSYSLTEVESSPTQMVLTPLASVLTPENPDKIKVLSLNNSLIHYNDQDFVFNDIARAMNVEASWTKHTNLGKPLSYHWDEGDGLAEDGTPGAKMMIRSDVWSHIILQEQSSLPRTNPETFRNNVAKWIEYIRDYCPNPNAVIIIPVNWAYSSDLDNFNASNNRFVEVYGEVAQELGAMVVPVAVAYDNAYTKEGKDELGTWFSDDRHPTLKATYMAACMEFGAITGIDPATISFTPSEMTAAEGAKMRAYASEALNGYENVINHLNGTVKFSTRIFDDYGIEYAADDVKYEVEEGGTISPEGVFTSDGTRGTFTIKVKCGDFAKEATVTVADHSTEYVTYPSISLNADNLSASEDFNSMGQEAAAQLPEAWRIDRQTQSPRTIGTYATAFEATTYAGGTSLPANAKNGVWNFGADQSEDRAPGGITTGVDNGTRAINLYTHLCNDGRKPIATVNVAYDIEKYRKGNNPAGFAVQLYYSYDGRNWQSAGNDFYTYLEPDNATEGYAEVPGETIAVEGQLPIGLGAGVDIYLAWNISVASGDAANGAMALAIDNVAIAGELPVVPETAHRIYVDNRTSWTSLGLYAYGDSELFGVWPGQAAIDELEVDGVTYQVFGLDNEGGSFNLIFNNWNNNKQLPDYPITATRDYWFRIDDNAAKEIAAPTGVEAVSVDNEGLSYDGQNIRLGEGAYVSVFSTDGRMVANGAGPIVNLKISAGLYIAVSGNQILKFIVRR